jgi:YHS domain-containing protein
MDIDPKTAAGSSVYEGKTYFFCAMGCKKDFDEDPAGVLKTEAAYDHSQGMDHGMMMSGGGAAKKPWWKFW